jgi:signal-transduction protein with cAMP-binding, CBS, and nucleotidyltransferase domain
MSCACHRVDLRGQTHARAFRPCRGTPSARGVLAGAPVFSALSDADERILSLTFVRDDSHRDEVVFQCDDAAGHLFLILSSSVKVSIPDEEGHEIVVAVEREGAVFGELALFDDAPRSATVTALHATQVVTLARDPREYPPFARADGAARVETDRGCRVP